MSKLRPLHLDIEEHIVESIASGAFGPNDMIWSENEIAARFEVSRSTVRKTIDRLVERGVLYRIPGKGTFVSNRVDADKSAAGIEKPMALVLPVNKSEWFSRIVVACEGLMDKNTASLVVVCTENSPKVEAERIKELIDSGIRHFLIIPICNNSKESGLRRVLNDPQVKAVLVDRYVPDLLDKIWAVVGNDKETAFNLVRHLLEHGYKNIGFISCSMTGRESSVQERLEGYLDAMGYAGINVEPGWIEIDNYQDEAFLYKDYPQYEMEQVYKYLNANKNLEAVIAGNDILALSIYNVAKQVGMTIPDDLAVVGFSNLSAGQYVVPGLTTVEQYPEKLVSKAVKILFSEEMEVTDGVQSRLVRVPQDIIFRGSCGCVEQSDLTGQFCQEAT